MRKYPTGVPEHADVDRIRDAYAQRDAAAARSVYRFTNPAYQAHTQDLEWEVLAELRRQGLELADLRVLEIGAGFGQMLHRLKEFGARAVTGMDLMEHRVEEARRRYPGLDITAGDAAQLSYADASFDLVTQFVVLSSVLDPGLRAAIAAEMWRVTAPGGLILSYDLRPTPAPLRALARLLGARGEGGGTPTVALAPSELAALFPGGEVRHRSVSLHFDLVGLGSRSRLLTRLLASIPLLRTHALVAIRKPRA